MIKHYFFKRVRKDWDNRRIDWVLLFSRDRYHWISRWYSKRPPSTGNLSIAEILNTNLASYSLDSQQKSHFDNYDFAAKASKHLYTQKLDRDACLLAHLAAEHLSKQIFLKTVLSYKNKYGLDFSTKHSEPHRSHEVSAIFNEIIRVSTEMRTLPELNALQLSISDFRSKIGDWAYARYDSPQSNNSECIAVGQALLADLHALVSVLSKKGPIP